MGLHDHLLARKQSVGDELASADGDLRVSHVCGLSMSCRLSRGATVDSDEVEQRRSIFRALGIGKILA